MNAPIQLGRPLAKFLLIAGAVLVLSTAACATSSAVRIGNVAYAPLPATVPVAVFYNEQSVGQPFELVGEVEVENPGKWQVLSVNDALPQLSQLARGLGANAIIVDSTEVIASGIVSRGFAGRARAIRVAAPGAAMTAGAPVQTTSSPAL